MLLCNFLVHFIGHMFISATKYETSEQYEHRISIFLKDINLYLNAKHNIEMPTCS